MGGKRRSTVWLDCGEHPPPGEGGNRGWLALNWKENGKASSSQMWLDWERTEDGNGVRGYTDTRRVNERQRWKGFRA